MTHDDIRKLIGGYATGSLSEAERKALFDAALDDQELFDELAREQALKELLEEPGVRQRLIAAIAPRPKVRPAAWWAKPWAWVAAAIGVGIIAVSTVLWRPPARREIAEVRIPALRSEAPPAALNAPSQPPVVPPATVASPAAHLQLGQQGQQGQRGEPKLPAELREKEATPPAFRDSASDKTESAKASEAIRAAAPAGPIPPAPAASAPAAGRLEVVPVPPSMADTVTVTEATLLKTESGQATGGRGGRGGGGRGGGGGVGGFQQFAAGARTGAATGFAFDYSVTPEGRLRILPSADGYLTVTVSNGDTSRVLFSDRPTQAASTVEVPLPADSTVATIIFARNTPAVAAAGIGLIDPPSGTKTDPAPSPNSKLQAIIELPPRE